MLDVILQILKILQLAQTKNICDVTNYFGVKCAALKILKARILCLKLLKMDSYKNVLES